MPPTAHVQLLHLPDSMVSFPGPISSLAVNELFVRELQPEKKKNTSAVQFVPDAATLDG